ncbi:MAG: phosphate/phosphite/phosphonate ABC transporter substrate-binding protein [Burkholderiales bacterium]|nr:phosphate/phosphite/phosphonate ABC transporter substrate-binding protein [Burkholderiales bacterium]
MLLLLCIVVAVLLAPALHAAEEPLIMGIFPRNKPSETTTMYTPLANHLSELLGRKVILVTARDFDAFSRAVQEGRYDIVFYNQFQYIQSSKSYVVIAHNEEFKRSAVAGVLYVRKDSGITEVSQLRGKTIIFGGGRDAMLSYIAPRFLLMQAGLNENDFKSEFSVNPPNAVVALSLKQADAAGGGDILLDLATVRKTINTEEIRILATTEPLLFLPWAVKRTMPARLRDAIQSTMVELDSTEAGRAILKSALTTGIRKAQDKDYDPHRRMINAVFGKGVPTR